MKKCINCGFEMLDGAVFCSECGTKFESLVVDDNRVSSSSDFDTICQLYDMEQKYHEAYNSYKNVKDNPPKWSSELEPPQLIKVQYRPYPTINPTVKMPDWWIIIMVPCLIVPVLGWFIWLMLWACVYAPDKANRKKKMIEEICNSEGYKAACLQVDDYNRQIQADADKNYQNQLEDYNKRKATMDKMLNQALDEYNNSLSIVQNRLIERHDELNALYNKCRLVPESHRDLFAIKGIYEIMRSADYTVKEAIEIYDRKKQMELTQQYIEAQQETNQHMAYRNSALDAQNEILYMQTELAAEANDIADEARRDANRAEFVRAIQHHNTNKYLKSISKR